MADNEEQVSSTTSFGDEVVHQADLLGPEDLNEAAATFNVHDIVDLVGGAQDAIDRHIAEDSALHEDPELFSYPPASEPEPVPVSEPSAVTNETPPGSESVLSPPDQNVVEPETMSIFTPEPQVAPPTPEPSLPTPEPSLPAPEPSLPTPEPSLPTPAAPPAAAAFPTREEEPSVAPASYEPSLPLAPPTSLMHFPTALGQKGESPAPISPLSPLHSPDSLEELSLTESPNQPPSSWASSAAPPGSCSALLQGMPCGALDDSGPARAKSPDDLPDPLAGPYLSLGKDPERHPNLCEDSGVSFSPEERPLGSSGPSPTQPQKKVLQLASYEAQLLASEGFRATMDTAPLGSAGYRVDLHGKESDEEDDLMEEEEKKNNLFDGFSPLADAAYSHFEAEPSDFRSTKVSEGPTPDLVQYREAEDLLESTQAPFEGKPDESSNIAMAASVQIMSQLSSGLKEYEEEEEEEDSPLPPSLPDILKSSPLNPEKPDSGSSEGSPEDQSPVLERRMMESPNPPINLSAINPFVLDSKVCLLKEMAEATEARLASKPKGEEDQCSGVFDLVKEMEEASPTKAQEEEPVKIEQKDWFSSLDSPKMPEKQPLNSENKKTLAEDSDSESPTADSLSPVLEAMAKNPASFQVESGNKESKLDVEMADEVSEHEVSSEEFEFIERPPRGVMDEFLEAFDNSKFASSKVPEIPLDEDLGFEKKETPCATTDEGKDVPSKSSYLLLTHKTSSPQKSKTELEKVALAQPAITAPGPQPFPSKPTEAEAEKMTGGIRLFRLPNLKMETVSELLYWRDVKTTGVVFGAALLLLLSLTACSIVSVTSYVALALLSVTVSFRIYKGILQAVQKSDEGHPFKLYLDQEVALSEEVAHKYSDLLLARVNKTIVELRRLFLVDDLVDSVKFAVLMWILTYVGALFNGLTLVILGVVAVFSFPIIYEKHQVQIDHYVGMVSCQVKDVVAKIQAKVPGAKRKAE